MKLILRNTRLEFQTDSFDVTGFIDGEPQEIETPEFKSVIVDAEDKVLWGRYHDNTTTSIDLTGSTIDGVAVQKIVNATIIKYNL